MKSILYSILLLLSFNVFSGYPEDDAERGDAIAQWALGMKFVRGDGVAQNYKAALKWFQLSAEQGFSDAQFTLGTMHHNGNGVEQNIVIAHMWFNIASANGHESAKKKRDSLEKSKMTKEQIAEAWKLARECVKNNYKDCS